MESGKKHFIIFLQCFQTGFSLGLLDLGIEFYIHIVHNNGQGVEQKNLERKRNGIMIDQQNVSDTLSGQSAREMKFLHQCLFFSTWQSSTVRYHAKLNIVGNKKKQTLSCLRT